jgi:hypothetical protein
VRVTVQTPTGRVAAVRAVQLQVLTGPAGLREVRIAAPADDGAVMIDVYSAGVAFPGLLMSRGRYQRKPEVPEGAPTAATTTGEHSSYV